jgi:hypothetical protein
MSLIVSYITGYLNVELKVQPDIRYLVFGLAGYPASWIPIWQNQYRYPVHP